ncbi:kinase-like domain-containing protein [Lanmaoa asiatica]|nr:kinase-like domain-containing protein [Lanmaoa asiatica]
MECYICGELIKRHEYNRHVGSHLAGNNMGVRLQPDDQLRSNDSLEDFLAQLSPVDNHRRAQFTTSRSPARTAVAPDRSPRQETSGGQSTQPNAFQLWLRNPTHDSPKYTTIDGQNSQPDLQAHEFIQSARVLRGTTKEEIETIVKEFKGFSCSDKETCLELVRKVPIFPGLVAYTYTHLIACPRALDKVRLLEILRATKVRPEEHKCNSALLNGTMVLNYDILNLAALAALCITESEKDDILDERRAQVEKLVELFHNLLEANVELEEWYRRHFFNALILLSKESGYCPRSIYLAKDTISGLVSVSRGGFGLVYKGKVGPRPVAVKALMRDGRVNLPEYKKKLSKEAIVWRHLRHPNCLPLYGIYNMPMDGPSISVALVSPWMNQGTLFEYLEHNPKANRIQLILDVVHGLDYLHSMQPHIAHRDIKPDNILITRKGRACLADFGLVSTFDTDDHFHTATSQVVMCGTSNYMAPEIFMAENKEEKRKVNKRACDMYALGCTIYAAYTGRHPFHGMHRDRVHSNVMSNHRPEFPNGKISSDMWSFVENLWGQDPSKRLTAQMALGWMEVKAYQEGVDSSLAPFDEEWEWKGPHDGKCLWSLSL